MAVMNVGGGAIADRLARRLGVWRVRVVFAVAAYAAASTLLLLLVLPGRAAVMPVLLVSVCSAGIGNSNYWAIAQHLPPPRMVGRAIGYLNTLAQAAGVAAPLLTGWMLGPRRQFDVALAIAGVCPLAAAGCLMLAGAGGLERIQRAMAEESTLRRQSSTLVL
jgi:MFS family permease